MNEGKSGWVTEGSESGEREEENRGGLRIGSIEEGLK